MRPTHPTRHVRPLLTAEEAIARDLIIDLAEQRAVPRPVRRHVRTALLLRRLAARLDPVPPGTAGGRPAAAGS